MRVDVWYFYFSCLFFFKFKLKVPVFAYGVSNEQLSTKEEIFDFYTDDVCMSKASPILSRLDSLG